MPARFTKIAVPFLMLGLVSTIAAADAPHAARRLSPPLSSAAERVEVSPLEVKLDGRRAVRQVVVTGYFHGEARDMTAAAQYRIDDPMVAKLKAGKLQAESNGKTSLVILAAGRTLRVPVTTVNVSKPSAVSFQFEVLPVLTKQGCASGSCHGSPHGKGGFSLSLYGYDPAIDRISLTRDGFNRRINVMEPADSLTIKKPLLEIPHVGGKRLHRGDAGYAILRNWIFEGAPTDLTAVQCAKIAVTPGENRVLRAQNRKQQISVVAEFSDGATRDVTPIATYESSNAAVASADADGLITGHGRGQAAISVRYLDKLVSLYITVVEDVPGFQWKSPPEVNEVDRLVDAKLKQLQYLPAPICGDSVFLRRVSLDLTGLLPSPERSRRFLADLATDRRAKLIDELLATEEYARFWALKRADLMRITAGRLKHGNAERFGDWIVNSYRTNQPYDRFVRDILSARGDAANAAPAGYFLAIPTMEERTEMTAQIFMGTRLECTKCHNHPFEKWTMRDYYSIAAVFARTQAAGDSVNLVSTGEALHPTTKEMMKPWGAAVGADPTSDRRAAFADWLVRPGNPYFARVEVNRIWADLFGRGIVDPVDDFRSSNPPSNVPLLDALARDLERSGYDRKQMIRLICNSRAYQNSAETNRFNATDVSLFSHARPRLLMAEQLKDAMALTTRTLAPLSGVEDRLQQLRKQLETPPANPEAFRIRSEIARLTSRADYATQQPVPVRQAFTVAFGQPERATACTCERQSAPTLLQALELLNGATPFKMAQGSLSRYSNMDDAHLIEEVYLAGLCRFPTARERDTALRFVAKARSRVEGVTDVVWALIGTQEFLFQH